MLSRFVPELLICWMSIYNTTLLTSSLKRRITVSGVFLISLILITILSHCFIAQSLRKCSIWSCFKPLVCKTNGTQLKIVLRKLTNDERNVRILQINLRFYCWFNIHVTYPTKHWEKGKKYCSNDVWLSKREHFIRLAPRICHKDERNGIEQGPNSGKSHI